MTETETKIVIEDGMTIGGKPVRDHLEALGHSEAYDLLFRLAKGQEITEANVKELHRLFYYRIDAKQAGKYRKHRVIIACGLPGWFVQKSCLFFSFVRINHPRKIPVL